VEASLLLDLSDIQDSKELAVAYLEKFAEKFIHE